MAMNVKEMNNKTLAELYADKVTVNLESTPQLAPDDVWKIMNIIAFNNKSLMNKNFK